jgi:hypothetical protein
MTNTLAKVVDAPLTVASTGLYVVVVFNGQEAEPLTLAPLWAPATAEALPPEAPQTGSAAADALPLDVPQTGEAEMVVLTVGAAPQTGATGADGLAGEVGTLQAVGVAGSHWTVSVTGIGDGPQPLLQILTVSVKPSYGAVGCSWHRGQCLTVVVIVLVVKPVSQTSTSLVVSVSVNGTFTGEQPAGKPLLPQTGCPS